MQVMRKLGAIALLTAIAACGDEPGLDLSGTWTATWSSMSGGGLVCNVGPVTLVLTHSRGAPTFSGSYSGGTATCTGPGGTGSNDVTPGVITAGSLSGSSVAFDVDNQSQHQTGTVAGAAMSGTAVWNEDLGNGSTLVLNGTWVANKR